MSQQIRQLEATLAAELFERNDNSIKLTQKGERLFADAMIILGQVDQTMDRMLDQCKRPTLAIGYYGNSLELGLGTLLKQHFSNRPKAHLTLFEGDSETITRSVMDGKLDCIITAFIPKLNDCDQFEKVHVTRSPYVLFAADGVVDAEPGSPISVSTYVHVLIATLTSTQGRLLSSQLQKNGLKEEMGSVHAPANTQQTLMILIQSGQ